jgi:hypothetical protein
MNHHEE